MMRAPGTIVPLDVDAPSNQIRAFVRSSGGYDVRNLLAFEHAVFVECAYLAILDRAPDPQGLANAMQFLAAGGDKILLLGGLRYSLEGRARCVHVRGLRARYALHRAYAVPVLGYLLESIVLAASLPRIARHARAVAFREAGRLHDAEQDAARRHDALERKLAYEADDREDLQRSIQALDASIQERAATLDTAFARLRKQWEDSLASGHMPSGLDAFYAQFEDEFRGSRDEIKARVAVFLPHLAEADIGSPDRPILDLGCGRGEWLEVLREHGLASRGVDLNRSCLDELRARGFDVVEADFVEYLREAADASVGAVTGMHIVEHLPFPTLVELVDHARRVLKPGGLVIFETPDPRNVLVASHTFYLDPTHRNPIPSALLKFLLETRGFTAVDVLELHPSDHQWLGVDTDFDRYLVANLFGGQDYAVVARTPGEG
jgi:O-antigen chain-terminating methyltransferase